MKNKLTCILTVKNKTTLSPLVPLIIFLAAVFVFDAQAADGTLVKNPSGKLTKNTSIKPLSPFTFDPVTNSSNSSDLYEQRTASVCLDFLAHLNHPRSDELFNRDGSLVRESENIKSVHWEMLDKEQYREGFMTQVNGEHPNIQTGYLERYADPHRILQRTLANPEIDRRAEDRSALWLYRLVSEAPFTYDLDDATSRLALPTWFPKGAMKWLGDEHGKFHLHGEKNFGGDGNDQWFLHQGKIYGVSNFDFKGMSLKYFNLTISKIIVDRERNAFTFETCALHAKKNK